MLDPHMLEKIEKAPGFIAALDQSGGSTPRALEVYGIGHDAYSNEDEMFALIHQMRTRIMMSPSFASGKIIGAILFEKTMTGLAGDKPVPLLLRDLDIAAFLKVDQGLEKRADGVQLMKPVPSFGELLDRASASGMAGTKMRSLIHAASRSGIKAVVGQQFDLARRILNHGLLPIIEPEVHLGSSDRELCDFLLVDELNAELETIPAGQKVILKLSLPARPNSYADLIDHPRTARVAALSGGYSRGAACAELARNRGMIASFSRALLQDLRYSMRDAEFDSTLARAIDEIYAASTRKPEVV